MKYGRQIVIEKSKDAKQAREGLKGAVMNFMESYEDSVLVERNRARRAFDAAIESGRLSADPEAENFVGSFMYMGVNKDGKPLFKHTLTRKYLN